MNMGEDFKDYVPIKNYITYGVSKKGDIIDFRSGKIISTHKNLDGYIGVNLRNKDGYKTFRGHRLVCEAFLEPEENKLEVDHINRIRHDNRVENLRWCNDLEQQENKEGRGVYGKFIWLEDTRTKKIPNFSWIINIDNYKGKFRKRFQYNLYSNEDIKKIRNEKLREFNIEILD